MNIVKNITKLESKKNWYIFYTAPRAEKVIKKELNKKGYDVFLPITKKLRIWKNRQKKIVDQVLFPSYIFINTEEHNLFKICQTPKIVTYIHCGGRPSKLNFESIKGIKLMLDLEQEITVEQNFTEGQNVRIIHGPLAGYEGLLVRQKSKNRFGIQLKEINQTVFIDICTTSIVKK